MSSQGEIEAGFASTRGVERPRFGARGIAGSQGVETGLQKGLELGKPRVTFGRIEYLAQLPAEMNLAQDQLDGLLGFGGQCGIRSEEILGAAWFTGTQTALQFGARAEEQ